MFCKTQKKRTENVRHSKQTYIMSFRGRLMFLKHDCTDLEHKILNFPLFLLTSPVVCRYLLCPGHLSVPVTGCRLTKCLPDGATHENTEGLQHSNPGPVLLLLQCHFGARPKAGPAPSQSVSFSPDFPNLSMSPEIPAVNLLTPSCVV